MRYRSSLAHTLVITSLALFAAGPAHPTDGSLDAGFGTNGAMSIAWDLGGAKNDYLTDMVASGEALFAVGYGSSITGDDDWEIARVAEDGTVTKAETYFDL